MKYIIKSIINMSYLNSAHNSLNGPTYDANFLQRLSLYLAVSKVVINNSSLELLAVIISSILLIICSYEVFGNSTILLPDINLW